MSNDCVYMRTNMIKKSVAFFAVMQSFYLETMVQQIAFLLLIKGLETFLECVEGDQWDCLAEKSRQQLQRSLATMETDSRPELKDKAQTLRRKIQGLP